MRKSPASRLTWRAVFRKAAADWSTHEITRRAATLAYYTIFSIAPLLLILVAVVGLFFGHETAESIVTGQVQTFLGAEKTKALYDLVVNLQKPGAGRFAGLVGFATLLLGAAGVVGELQATLNQVYGAAPSARGVLVTLKRRLISIGFVLGMGFLLLVSLGLSAGAAAAGKYFSEYLHVPAALLQLLNQAVSFGVITTLFVGMFRFLPEARLAWRDLWVGGAVTAALFTLGNLALGLYLGKAGPTSAYGAAGSLLAVLLWAYYCAQIVYFGAEVTQAYADGRGSGVRSRQAA
jgi:membrane protein